MRFHLDEHIHPAVADALRRRGIDVTTTREAKLEGATDLQQLAYAHQGHRVVVTSDQDFLIFASSEAPHSGIVFCTRTSRIRTIIESLLLIDACLAESEMANHVEFC